MFRRIGKQLSSGFDWLFQDLRDTDSPDGKARARKEEIQSLKREGTPAFRRFCVTLRYQLVRVVRWFLLLLLFFLIFWGFLFLYDGLSNLFPEKPDLAPAHDPPEQANGLSEWVVPTILLLLLIGSPLYLANDLFKSDGGDVSDPDDGIGCAIFLVVFIPAWLIVLGLLAYFYLNWIQVITAVLSVPVSLIALFIWITLTEDKQTRKE
jgi:hypothetical protein